MGRVGKIIAGTVGVAINVFPGIGQAISGAIYGGLAGGAVGSAAAAALGFGRLVTAGLALYGLSTAINLAGSLFASGAPKPEPAERQERNATPKRIYICGRRRSRRFGAILETISSGQVFNLDRRRDRWGAVPHRTNLRDGQNRSTLSTTPEATI